MSQHGGAFALQKYSWGLGFEAAQAQNAVFILVKLYNLLCYIPSNVVSLLMSFKIHFPPVSEPLTSCTRLPPDVQEGGGK